MDPVMLAAMIQETEETGGKRLLPGLGAKLAAFTGFCVPSLTEYMMRKSIFDKLPNEGPNRVGQP